MKRSWLGIATLLLACSGSGQAVDTTHFDGPALLRVPTDSGNLVVELRTSPSPLVRGTNAVQLTVLDTSGAPVDGLDVSMTPWMVAHAHGTSVVPLVVPQGAGHYLVTEVAFFMPGRWQLRTTIAGPMQDEVTPSVDVP